ncbi:hypothetical protein [Arthrobacter tecti]
MQLHVKPVQRSAAGNWVTGQLRWETFNVGYSPGELNQVHWDWMCTFAALSQQGHRYHSYGSPMRLNDFRSPLLWELLKRARVAGVELVGAGKGAKVTLHDSATVHLDVSSEDQGMTLAAIAEADGQMLDRMTLGLIGSPAHGLFWWDGTAPLAHQSIELAPTAAEVPEAVRPMIVAQDPLKIPGTGRDAFLADYYPQLRQQVNVVSRDNSVELPEILPPTLVLKVTYVPASPSTSRRGSLDAVGSNGLVRLTWSWEYTHGERRRRTRLRTAATVIATAPQRVRF